MDLPSCFCMASPTAPTRGGSCSTVSAAADRRAIAVDLPGFATADPLRDGKVLPQLDRFAAAVVSAAAAEGGGEVVVSGNSLGGCVALRAAQREKLPLAGVVPIAPAGLDMARWFVLVEREPILRTLLAVPTPLPEAVVRQVVARAYQVLAFARPGEIEPAMVDAFTSHHRNRATVEALPGHRAAADPRAQPRDLPAARSGPMPRPGRVGRARRHGRAERRRADRRGSSRRRRSS